MLRAKPSRPLPGATVRPAAAGTQIAGHINIAMMGEISVGKTCLLQRFLGYAFPTSTEPTILDCMIREFTLGNSEQLDLRIHDTAGQERFYALSQQFYRISSAFIVVYDESQPTTLLRISEFWIPKMREFNTKARHLLLVGNKSDLATPEHRADNERLLAAMHTQLETYKVTMTLLSAKTSTATECTAVFDAFCRRIILNYEKGERNDCEGFELIP